jgi:hypothetical protein
MTFKASMKLALDELNVSVEVETVGIRPNTVFRRDGVPWCRTWSTSRQVGAGDNIPDSVLISKSKQDVSFLNPADPRPVYSQDIQ